jgi:hypothetical protein
MLARSESFPLISRTPLSVPSNANAAVSSGFWSIFPVLSAQSVLGPILGEVREVGLFSEGLIRPYRTFQNDPRFADCRATDIRMIG